VLELASHSTFIVISVLVKAAVSTNPVECVFTLNFMERTKLVMVLSKSTTVQG